MSISCSTPRLILLYKAFAPFRLALLLSVFLLSACPSARASHWAVAITGSVVANASSNVQNSTPPTWTAPTGTTTNGGWAPGYTVSSIGYGGYNNTAGSATASYTLTVTMTGTWTHDGDTDPAPPSVCLYETSAANYLSSNVSGGSGTANDGFGDTATSYSEPGFPSGGRSSGPNPSFKYVTVTGGVWTETRTFSATANASSQSGSCTAKASYDGWQVQVHAQPYNWTMTGWSDNNGSGILSFIYYWKSTSGRIADLGSCFWHERVTYPGSANPYVTPAPFTGSYPNPTISPGLLQHGGNMATTSATDSQVVWPMVTVEDRKPVDVPPINQRYEFDDTTTGEVDVLVPGPDSTATIVRTIGTRGNAPGLWYSVTKQGHIAWLQVK